MSCPKLPMECYVGRKNGTARHHLASGAAVENCVRKLRARGLKDHPHPSCEIRALIVDDSSVVLLVREKKS